MSFVDCINRAVKDEAVTVQRGEDARNAYERAYKKAKQDGKNDFEAEDIAARKATNQLTTQTSNKRYQRMRNMQALDKLITDWDASPKTMNGADKLFAILEGDVRWKGDSFDSKYKSRRGEYHNAFLDVIDKYRPKWFGTYSTKSGLDNLVKELAGEKSGDVAAKEFADVVQQGIELIVKKANSAGAAIEMNPRWWLPMKLNKSKMRNNKAKWIETFNEKLDWTHTKYPDGSDVLDEEKFDFLSNAFDSIDTQGWNKIKFGVHGENLADRMSKGRVLYFKDAAAWLDVNKQFGDGNPYDYLIDWIDSMARNTAMLDVYGTSPTNTINYLTDRAKNDASIKQSEMQTSGKVSRKSPVAELKDDLSKFEDTWQLATLGNKSSDENTFATIMSTTRNITRSALLSGSIFANVFGDTANVSRTMMMNNLSPVKYLDYYTKLAAKNTTRKEAIRAGLIADEATNRMIGAERFFIAEQGARWSKYVSDVVMRASGISPHTQIAKWATGMSYMGEFADNAGKSFDELPFKAVLERYGVTPDEWDIMRKVIPHQPKDLNILRPNDLRGAGVVSEEQANDIADKFMNVIFSESKRSVIEATYRARAAMGANVQAGTIKGEALRTFGEFKSFPMTITMALGQELLLKKGAFSKISHITKFFLYMTIAGAGALQMSNLASGKDPQDMNDPKFWGQAAMKGGSFGYLGDFLFADYNEYGASFGESLLGPSSKFWFDIGKMSIGTGMKVAAGEETEIQKQAVQFAQKYMPASKIPVVKSVFERSIIDQLLLAVDPKAAASFRKSEQKLMKDKNQKRWWKKGDALPNRAPDFSAVIQK